MKFEKLKQGTNEEVENKSIEYWENIDILRRSIETREGNDMFVFYDGPPFANGLPHYGHIMISYVKDIVLYLSHLYHNKELCPT